MYFAKSAKSLAAQEKEINRPWQKKDYFELAKGNNGEDFSKVLEWTKGVMNMYEKDLIFFKEKVYKKESSSFDQAWKYWIERKPIFIDPDFKASMLDASYSRVVDETYGGLLQFNAYPSNNGKTVYTSQNEDVVSHEAGHAFLDIICPAFYTQLRFQTQAIHESFGDLTCLFYHLSDVDNRRKVLEETKGNLSVTSFVTLIAEPLNKGTKYGELRNLLNDKKMGQTLCEQHDLSNVFSAAIYELLEELFNALIDHYTKDPLEVLLDQAQYVLRLLLLQSLIEIPYPNPSFSDIGKQMQQRAKIYTILAETDFAKKVQEVFSKKGIDITKPHTDDDDICKINLQQPDQGLRSFCSTFSSGFFYN